jgi:hypothetical protein
MRVVLLLMYVCPVISSQCVQCAPGKFRSNDVFVASCTNCSVNTYSPSPGMTACRPCEANSASDAGSSSCTCVQNYARVNASAGCTFACANGRVRVGDTCQCPAGSSGGPTGSCALCAVHTYASQVGSSVCSSCPDGMRSAVGSASAAACVCGVGFLKIFGACMQLLDFSVVLKFDMLLEVPSDVSMEQVRQTIVSVVSVAYNISAEFLVVDIVLVPGVSPRRLMQVASTNTYSVTIRVLFAVGASPADVSQIQSTIATIDTPVKTGMQNGSSGVHFYVLNSTVPEVRNVIGVFNAISREVVTCTLVPWQDERGAAQACERTCGVDEDVVAVAYVQGLYVLDCRRTTTTTTTPIQIVVPEPGSVASNLNIAAIAIGASVGGACVIGIVACIILNMPTVTVVAT